MELLLFIYVNDRDLSHQNTNSTQRYCAIAGRKTPGQAYAQDFYGDLQWGAMGDLHRPLQALSS